MLRCREVVERVKEDKKALSSALVALAVFDAGLGRFDEARDLVARAKTVLQEVALTVWLAGPIAQFAGWVELLAGDPAAAERELRWGYDKLREIGELSWLSTVAGILAEAVYLQGRYDEAEELTRVSEETAGTEDVYSQVLWRSVRAKRLARRGETDEADRLAQEAVELAEGSDFAQLRWFALLSRAEVLSLVGKTEEVEPLLRDAAALAERKGSVVAARAAASLHARLVEPLQI
jgi:ATP/maltotriose-dependent transcriptional regulator MalT